MCLKDKIQKLRNQIKYEEIKNALHHDATLNFINTIISEEGYGTKYKRGEY